MIYKVKNLFNIVYCTFKEIFDINLYKTQESTAIAGQILKIKIHLIYIKES